MSRQGFFVKNILVIGDQTGENEEYKSHKNIKITTKPGVFRTLIMNDGILDLTRADRIVEQIKIIGEFAKEIKKKDKRNQLTRVVTDEFSFYTKNTPLTIEEYKSIIDKTFDAIKALPPNIVLIISSMPVLWPDKSLRNALLHIQSPNDNQSNPIIHHLSKESCSFSDPYYSKDNTTHNCYEFRADDYTSPSYSPDTVLQGTKAQCADKNQYKSAIIVQGMDIPAIIDAIDVCLDHANGVGMKNAEQLLKNTTNPPFHISHIITSNTIYRHENSLTAAAVHADQVEKDVEGVFEKKSEPLDRVFGKKSSAFIYGAKRADILHAKLFDIAIKNSDKPISDSVDNHGNTLLHQILFKNKKNNPLSYTHRAGLLSNILREFDANTINKQNKEGNTPLHIAMHTLYDENMLLQFLERGATLSTKNDAKITPIEIAHQNNSTHLIDAMCNKVINHEASYLAHQDTILELTSAIKNQSTREKLARGALLRTLSMSNSDENTIVGLLENTGNPAYFIQNNLSQLVSKAATHTKLYDYLTTQNTFKSENQEQITTLPENIRLQLVKQACSENLVSEERLNLFLHKLNVLQHSFNDSECNLLLTYHPVFSDKIVKLSEDEKKVAKAYLVNDYQKLFDISKKSNIDPPKIARAFSSDLTQHVTNWINQELIKNQLQESVQDEFKKGTDASLDKIQIALLQNLHLDEPCGLNNQLTLGEQIIAQTFISKNAIDIPQLQFLFDTTASLLTADGIKKIADSFTNPPNLTHGAKATSDEVKIWIYQNRVKNELIKAKPHDGIMIDTLSQGKVIWESACFTYPNELNQTVHLSIAEEIVVQALKSNDPKLLEHTYIQLKIEGQSIDTAKISSIWGVNNLHIAYWINQELIKIQHQESIREEFKKGIAANLDKIQFVLSQNIHLNAPCGLDNELTLGEQTIAQAFISKSTVSLEQLQFLFDTTTSLLTTNAIKKIANSFANLPNSTHDAKATSDKVKIWIYQEQVKNELRKPWPNHHIILNALSQGKTVWSAACFTTYPSGLNQAVHLSIAEAIVVQSLKSNDPKLLEHIYFQLKIEGQSIDTAKISSIWGVNNLHIAYGINQELIKIQHQESIRDEFKKGAAASLDKIQFALFQNLHLNAPCGLDNELTLGEQTIAQAFISKTAVSLEQLQFLFDTTTSLLTADTIQKIADSFANPPNSTHGAKATSDEVKIWIYQEQVKNELRKPWPNHHIILNALSQGKTVWSAACFTYPSGLNQVVHLSIADAIIVQAINSNNQTLLEHAYIQLKTAGQSIDTIKISSIWRPYHLYMSDWITQELKKIDDQQAISNEFQTTQQTNVLDKGAITLAMKEQLLIMKDDPSQEKLLKLKAI